MHEEKQMWQDYFAKVNNNDAPAVLLCSQVLTQALRILPVSCTTQSRPNDLRRQQAGGP